MTEPEANPPPAALADDAAATPETAEANPETVEATPDAAPEPTATVVATAIEDAPPVDLDGILTLRELQARVEARALSAGALVKARIVSADASRVTLEVDETRGVAPRDEFGDAATPGTEVEVYVDDPDADPVEFSRHKAVRLALWRWVESLRESGEQVAATVLSESRGDLAVDLGGIKAVLPMRELAPGRARDPEALRGQTLEVRVTRIREKKGIILVSERAPVTENREVLKSQTLESLEVGALIEGEVKRLAKFGAFVDIGGIDGLLHVNDLSHRRVRHPSEVVDVGDVITVKVLKYDPEKERVALGLKQTLPDPWTVAAERYTPGTPVHGEVVGLTKFGAFVMLPDGIEGLVHVSEMRWGKAVDKPGDAVRKGQAVDAWVLRVEPDRKRMGLTLKDPADNPWRALADRLTVGTRLETTVARVADFGIFVHLDEENDLAGLVHQSDFSWGPTTKPVRALFEPGQPVEVMVLGVDIERGRAALGIKHLHEDLASELIRNYTVGQTIEGTVTSVQDFGAFIELEPGLEGLAPVSELRDERVEHPDDVLDSGARVTATIIGLDPVERKLTLSLRGHALPAKAGTVAEAEDAPEDGADGEAAAGEAANAEAPAAEAPAAEAPVAEAPVAEAPVAEAATPEAAAPEAAAPEAAAPEAAAPEAAAPVAADAEQPEAAAEERAAEHAAAEPPTAPEPQPQS